MKKMLAYVILLIYLTITQAKFTINSASDGFCDTSGKGLIELELTKDNSTNSSLSFELILKSNFGNIQANCSSENVNNQIQTRILEESITISCTFVSPEVEGKYELNLLDDENEIELSVNSIYANIFPCITEEQAFKRLNISISFRQVNLFNLSALSFTFYGLTSAKLENNYEINFFILLNNGTNYLSTLIETNCTLSTFIEEFSNITPVTFSCLISKENLPIKKTYNVILQSVGNNKMQLINKIRAVLGLSLSEAKALADEALNTPVTIKEGVSESEAEYIKKNLENLAEIVFEIKEIYDFSSIEIAYSDFVAGFPTDNSLMNPTLTQEAINEGNLIDVSSAENNPVLVDKPTINTSLFGKGILTVSISSVIENMKVDQSFSIKLKYPGGLLLNCTVIEIGNDETIINCSIIGKVITQKLFIEQTIISCDGAELFVLPSFEITIRDEENKEKEEMEEGIKEEMEVEIPLYENLINEEEQEKIKEENNQKEETPEKYEETNEELSDKLESIKEEKEESEESEKFEESEETNEELPDEWQSSIITESTNLIIDEQLDQPISKEDAEKKAKIFISFRQLNRFLFKDGVIIFNFFGLTTQKVEKGNIIELFANLIGVNGIEENARKIKCESQDNVNPQKGKSLQIKYICQISGLNISEGYTSFRLNYSNYIAGIPKDNDILLNPYLTDEAIINEEIKDCSKDSIVPPTFTINLNSSDNTNCDKNGIFFLKGELSEKKPIVVSFTIPLTYPEGISISCSFEGNGIQCLTDKEIDDEIVIEQTMITYGNEELFNFNSIIHKNLKCVNGLLKKAEDKTRVDISFRQVSHIQRITNGFAFFFAAFANKNLSIPFHIPMNIIINILDNKIEKISNCSLEESVTTYGEIIQADFTCEISLTSDENIPLENISISTKNEIIGGLSQLTKEELSPKATDDAINNSSNAFSDLGVTVDYYKYQNKNVNPLSLKIISFDLTRCEKKGKLKIKGSFNKNIPNEIIFNLPFSYPNTNIKCLVDKAIKGEIVDITCKMQKIKKFREFKTFVLEPKIIKIKKKEVLFIESGIFELEQQYNCTNFNELKFKNAIARKNALFSFLQIGRLSDLNKLFFLALMKKNKSAQFEAKKYQVSLIMEISRSIIGNKFNLNIFKSVLKNGKKHIKSMDLKETEEIDDIEVECLIGNRTDNAAVYECENDSGKIPFKIDINSNEISGMPNDALIETEPNPDYTKKEILEIIDTLPNVKIYNLTSKKCSINGTYEIKAKIINDKTLYFNTKDNIIIPFSNPDSKGLCTINVEMDQKNLVITCENVEAFSPTEIIITPQIVYDKDHKTPLFKIDEDYISSTQFYCIISDKSLIESSGEYDTIFYRNKKSKNGSNGGLIAGIIIIVSIIVISITILINVLLKKRYFSNKHTEDPQSQNNLTIEKINVNNNNNKMI